VTLRRCLSLISIDSSENKKPSIQMMKNNRYIESKVIADELCVQICAHQSRDIHYSKKKSSDTVTINQRKALLHNIASKILSRWSLTLLLPSCTFLIRETKFNIVIIHQ
jgi:hypothetical protein